MRRIFAWVLALCVIGMSGAAAEGATSGWPAVLLEDMTVEELLEVRDRIDEQIAQLSADGYDAGTYAVGVEIPAGDYVLIADKADEMASFTLDVTRERERVTVLFEVITNRTTVRLRAGETAVFYGVRAYLLAGAPPVEKSDGVIAEGGYLAGEEIPAETYTIRAREEALFPSYTVYSEPLGSASRTVSFELVKEDRQITLAAGEYILLSGCELVASAS